MKKVDKVKTAIVGCGMISNIYLRNLKNLFYIIDLVAVCDLNPASAEAKAHTYGVAEMAWAIRTGRPNRCSKEMALHAQEDTVRTGCFCIIRAEICDAVHL